MWNTKKCGKLEERKARKSELILFSDHQMANQPCSHVIVDEFWVLHRSAAVWNPVGSLQRSPKTVRRGSPRFAIEAKNSKSLWFAAVRHGSQNLKISAVRLSNLVEGAGAPEKGHFSGFRGTFLALGLLGGLRTPSGCVAFFGVESDPPPGVGKQWYGPLSQQIV